MSHVDPPSAALERAQALLDARIDWERRDRGSMRVDVGPSLDLCARLGEPQRSFRTVHVGGTKGKGSVGALVAAGLEAHGWRVGLYSSPHVERVTERVRIQGAPVADDLLAAGIDAALAAREEAERAGTPAATASWFDLFTAGAFHALRAAEVDWAVVEVGLGGRLDSTNVLDAALAVITNIDLEHTAVLGSTRAAIAGEKAGILRPGLPFVCGVPVVAGSGGANGPDEAGRVLVERARALGCPTVVVEPASSIEATNLALARAALESLAAHGATAPDGGPLEPGRLTRERGRRAQLPGRLERREGPGGVPVVLDGAHVGSSVDRVLSDLEGQEGLVGPPQVVLAAARDKDHGSILKALLGRVDRVHSTTVPSGIHLEAAALARMAAEAGLEVEEPCEARDALRRACARAAASGGWVLGIGSLYLAGALRGDTGPPADPDRSPCSP